MEEQGKVIWMDGRLVPWGEARVHFVSNTLHYGFGAFEGIRCYRTAKGPAIFRLKEHVDRLFGSCHILGLKVPYTREQVTEAIRETVRANEMETCYIRPMVYIGYGGMGLQFKGLPVNVAIAVWYWGEYLGGGALSAGVRVKTSSFVRHHINANMVKAKANANYLSFQLAKAEAQECGYDEALLLDVHGNVAEGSVEHIFMSRHGELKTPPLTCLMEGITRDSLMQLARAEGLAVREEFFSRDELYVAEEAFFCGTGAEVTPIREVDGRQIGDGKPGPLTSRLQELYFRVVRGEDPRFAHWLAYVSPRQTGA